MAGNARSADQTTEATETDIPPALTPSEWWNVKSLDEGARSRFAEFSARIGRHHAAMAIENDVLHDEDPRKFSREYVELLRNAAGVVMSDLPGDSDGARTEEETARAIWLGNLYSQLWELSEVIESYLPPIAEQPER